MLTIFLAGLVLGTHPKPTSETITERSPCCSLALEAAMVKSAVQWSRVYTQMTVVKNAVQITVVENAVQRVQYR